MEMFVSSPHTHSGRRTIGVPLLLASQPDFAMSKQDSNEISIKVVRVRGKKESEPVTITMGAGQTVRELKEKIASTKDRERLLAAIASAPCLLAFLVACAKSLLPSSGKPCECAYSASVVAKVRSGLGSRCVNPMQEGVITSRIEN